MYDFVDRPVSALDEGGRFLIWVLRNWVRAMSERQCPAHAVAPAFARWKMMGALPPFHHMLLALNVHGRQAFCVAPVECRHVAEDEAVLLSLFCRLRDGQSPLVQQALALMVDEEHVGTMLVALCKLADALMRAGIPPTAPAAIASATRNDCK